MDCVIEAWVHNSLGSIHKRGNELYLSYRLMDAIIFHNSIAAETFILRELSGVRWMGITFKIRML